MELLIADHPLLALFVLSFLAATVLPLGSEWLLVLLLVDGAEPLTLVGVATVGNTLGACTTYAIGIYGGPWVIKRLLRIDTEQEKKAERYYARYGSWSLLLSWMPFIGDPICLVGGILRIGFGRFLVLVSSGKFLRYATVACLTVQVQWLPAAPDILNLFSREGAKARRKTPTLKRKTPSVGLKSNLNRSRLLLKFCFSP